MDKIQIMKIYKNFMKSKFVRSSKTDPEANLKSPAMYLKIENKILKHNEVFPYRRFYTHYALDDEEKLFYNRKYKFSRRKIGEL